MIKEKLKLWTTLVVTSALIITTGLLSYTFYLSSIVPGATFTTVNAHLLEEDYAHVIKTNDLEYDALLWKNDSIDTKVSVYTGSNALTNVNVSVSDLSNGSNVISSDNIDIGWLKDTLVNIGTEDPNAPVKQYPDIISTETTLDSIDGFSFNSCWITIHTTEATVEGIYEGVISVSADQLEQPYELTLEIEVVDLVLDSGNDSNVHIELWQHPYTWARYYQVDMFSDEYNSIITKQFEEYASIGGQTIVAPIVEEAWNHQSYDSDPSLVKWYKSKDGYYYFDYSMFDQWVQLAIDANVLDMSSDKSQIKCYSIAPWANQITYYDEALQQDVTVTLDPSSYEWENAWSAFLYSFMEHTQSKGWFDAIYIALDERDYDSLLHCVDFIHSIVDQNGNSFKISAALNYDSGKDYTFLNQIDDISIGISHIQGNDLIDLANARKELDLLTTIYTCSGDYPNSNIIADPIESEWSILYALNQHCDGFLRWSWDGWVENPLEDTSYRTFEAGDMWFIYPSEVDNQQQAFYSSPRYQLLKQGINDANKLLYLSTISDEYNTKVTQLIEDLIRPSKTINQYGSATYSSISQRENLWDSVNNIRTNIDELSKTIATNY